MSEPTVHPLLVQYGLPGARPGSFGRALSKASPVPEEDAYALCDIAAELISLGQQLRNLDALARAWEILQATPDRLVCPPGTWCMVSRYYSSPQQEPDRFDENIWSAHYTQAEAERWAAAYTQVFAEKYLRMPWPAERRFTAEQRDDAHIWELRRSDVDPFEMAKAAAG